MLVRLFLTLALATVPALAYGQETPVQDEHHPEQGSSASTSEVAPPAPGAGETPNMSGMMQNMMPGMSDGMMAGRRSMQHGTMGGLHARLMIIMLDTDGDGALSLEEVQAVHERMFEAVDGDEDGRVTSEELRAFMSGAVPAPQ